jgi:MFS family permease
MSTETSAGTLGRAAGATPRPKRSLGGLIAISIFWFALNFHWAAVGVILVPSQVIGILFQVAPGATLAERADWTNAHAGLAQALVVAPGLIVALLANPFFGLLSDRTPGRFGRRRPYILLGTLVNVVGLGVMALASRVLGGSPGVVLSAGLLVLLGGLLLTQASNNAAAAPFHALLPDLVPQQQRGAASGIMGLAYWLGTIGGSLAPTLFGFNSQALLHGTQSFDAYQQGIERGYASVIVVILLMALLTVISVRETPWKAELATAAQTTSARRASRNLAGTVVVLLVFAGSSALLIRAVPGLPVNEDTLSVLELAAVLIAGFGAALAFDFRPRRNPDFTWVILTRMLVMMGVYIVQNFLILYMTNVAHAPNPQAATTLFLILLTLSATLSTALAGWASDRVGRKRMVYVSGTFMAVVGAVFVLAPFLFPGDVLPVALVMGAIFGLGFGAYISVDWALVADVLPDESTYARDMGVWNIALTLPQVFAVVFGGWLLAFGAATGNLQLGYTLLFVWFVIFCVLGTITVRNIKGVKR